LNFENRDWLVFQARPALRLGDRTRFRTAALHRLNGDRFLDALVGTLSFVRSLAAQAIHFLQEALDIRNWVAAARSRTAGATWIVRHESPSPCPLPQGEKGSGLRWPIRTV
jgi:hypothetical protein